MMAFRWRADDGPLLVVFGSSLPSSTKKPLSWTPSDKFLDPRLLFLSVPWVSLWSVIVTLPGFD